MTVFFLENGISPFFKIDKKENLKHSMFSLMGCVPPTFNDPIDKSHMSPKQVTPAAKFSC